MPRISTTQLAKNMAKDPKMELSSVDLVHLIYKYMQQFARDYPYMDLGVELGNYRKLNKKRARKYDS